MSRAGHSRRGRLFAATVLTLVGVGRSARAQSSEVSSVPPPAPLAVSAAEAAPPVVNAEGGTSDASEITRGVDIDVWQFFHVGNAYSEAGSGSYSSATGGAGIGADVSMRKGLVRFGTLTDAQFFLAGTGSVHAGAFVGPTWAPRQSLRFDAVAELGGNYISGIGQGLFVTQVSGGTSALLPFTGIRLSAAWRSQGRHHAIVGLWVGLREDLTRETRTPEVTNCLLSCSTSPETWRLGGETALAGFRVGFEQ
jgi:hypothetical protein